MALLLSPSFVEVGSGHLKNCVSHSACVHEAPSPEMNEVLWHPAAVQHEHMQSLPPHGVGGGGAGQPLESSNRATILPGEPAGSTFPDGHLRAHHAGAC